MSIFTRFAIRPELVEKLKTALTDLCCTKYGCWVSVTLNHSNATCKYGSGGTPFTEAFVDAKINRELKDDIFGFGSIFEDYFFKLESYLKDPMREPVDKTERLLISKLLEFILDPVKGQRVLLTEIHKVDWKGEVAMILAEHLFTKLTLSPFYTVDMTYPNSSCVKKCPCGCRVDVSNRYGDTSIGNSDVWHGRLDLMVGSVPVIVEEDEEPQAGKPSEVKYGEALLDDPKSINQIIAQTIVFSFLQKNKHPELSNFLIPTIAATRSHAVFYLYDSENDILLRSRNFPLFDSEQVNMTAILAIWFVVNYKVTCSGIDKKEKFRNVKQADFFKLAGHQLPVYQNKLSFGNVKPGVRFVSEYEPFSVYSKVVGVPPRKKLKSK